jgi:hypothetical protein
MKAKEKAEQSTKKSEGRYPVKINGHISRDVHKRLEKHQNRVNKARSVVIRDFIEKGLSSQK